MPIFKKSVKIEEGNYILFRHDDRRWYSGKVRKILPTDRYFLFPSRQELPIAGKDTLNLDVSTTDRRLLPATGVWDSRKNIYPVEERMLAGQESLENVRKHLRAVEPFTFDLNRLFHSQIDEILDQFKVIRENYTCPR